MNSVLLHDLNDINNILEEAKKRSIEFLDNIENIPTSNKESIDVNKQLNELGLGSLGALEEFNQRLAPLMVASSGPRYWGFVTGGSTPASIVGDWLASV